MHHPFARSVRRALTSATALTCAGALAATFTAGAQAKTVTSTKKKTTTAAITPSTPIGRGAGYLALGDSVSFGYMEPQVLPTPDYTAASNFVGFPEVIASDLHLKLANAACPGETSASFVSSSAQSYGCETSPIPTQPAYRATFPLHVKYSGTQLAYAVKYLKMKKNANVRLVTVIIGANDFFLCEATTTDQCQSPLEQAGVVGTVEKNVKTIVAALRDKAHYTGQLVLVDYYDTPAVPAVEVQTLNHYINLGTSGFHVRIANAFNSFAQASAHSSGNACTAGLLTQLSTGGCGVHPSSAGQTLLASTIIRSIRLR